MTYKNGLVGGSLLVGGGGPPVSGHITKYKHTQSSDNDGLGFNGTFSTI